MNNLLGSTFVAHELRLYEEYLRDTQGLAPRTRSHRRAQAGCVVGVYTRAMCVDIGEAMCRSIATPLP
jgi:hypothetical protein